MKDQVFVRMGDGERVLMSSDQIKEELLTGTQEAAERAEIPALTTGELEQLFDIIADPSRIVSVAPGEEVVTTDDAVCTLFYLDQDNSGQGIPMSRVQSVLAYERACAADTVSIGHTDYSYKQVKPIINVNSSKSIPWNLARAVTFVKATAEVARIQVHPNVGMGVCGVPVFEVPPIDAVTRAAKSLVQIGKADGL